MRCAPNARGTSRAHRADRERQYHQKRQERHRAAHRRAKGPSVAVAAGVRVGDADAQLEVLANVTEDQLPLLDEYLSAAKITVSKSSLRCPFDIQVRVFAGGDTAFVQIVGSHTNVVRIEKNGEVLLNKPFFRGGGPAAREPQEPDGREDIIAFADEVDLDDVRAPIARQIEYNTAIAEAGLTGQYGAAIGKSCSIPMATACRTAPRLGCRGLGRAHERLRKACCHQLWQRQSGHDGFAARRCLRARELKASEE